MKFFDREDEMARLREIRKKAAEAARFAFVKGRRRVGKTQLVKRTLEDRILYEDRDVIVIDKPAGVLTTHTRAKETNTVEEWLNDYVRKGQLRSRKHVWLVHRLDRETSGVMMFAKSEAVAEKFRADWNKLTEKTYRARVEGVMAEEKGVFESYLQEDADGYKVRSVASPKPSKLSKPAKLSRTEWKKLSVEDNTTLVEVTLKSGRKNQIRVHFSEAGHPVIGDEKYGGQKATRLYLHAFRLRIRHPHTGEWLDFESPAPRGLRQALIASPTEVAGFATTSGH